MLFRKKYVAVILLLLVVSISSLAFLHEHHTIATDEDHCFICNIIHDISASDTAATHTGHFIPLKGFRIDTLKQDKPSSELQNQNSDRAPPSVSHI